MKPKLIIGTCVYNRTWTLPHYFKALQEKTKNPFHVYLIVNYDELWSEKEAKDAVFRVQLECREKDLVSNPVTIVFTYNLGLGGGYNIALEAAKNLDVPCFLCNDDVIPLTNDWDEILLTMPTEEIEVYQHGMKKIRPESIGVVAPTYVNFGCMGHQKVDPQNLVSPYFGCDYVVGHSQMITLNAIRKDFKFESEYCTQFGPMDIFQSEWMGYHELNTIVNKKVVFDFPNSEESAFSCGDNKFSEKLTPVWQQMSLNLEKYRKMKIDKFGFNKWWYE